MDTYWIDGKYYREVMKLSSVAVTVFLQKLCWLKGYRSEILKEKKTALRKSAFLTLVLMQIPIHILLCLKYDGDPHIYKR
jgi:hypothetical protein